MHEAVVAGEPRQAGPPESPDERASRALPLARKVAASILPRAPGARSCWYDDVVSECWMGIVQAARTYKGLIPWDNYAGLVARRWGLAFIVRQVGRRGFKGLDAADPARRVNRVPATASLDEIAGDTPGLGVEPAGRVAWDDATWERALGGLPTRQRETVEGKYRRGLPTDEVADSLGITTNAATNAIWQGLKNLRAKGWLAGELG